MSSATAWFGWAGLPFAAGVALAWLLAPGSAASTATPGLLGAAPTSAASPMPSGPAATTRESGDDPTPDCAALERELTRLDGQVEAWFGASPPWPDTSDAFVASEARFTEWMDQTARELEGTTVVEVDCGTYPCIGLFRVERSAASAFLDSMDSWEALPQHTRLVPIKDASGEHTHWLVTTSSYVDGTADPAMVSLRLNAAASAHGAFDHLEVR